MIFIPESHTYQIRENPEVAWRTIPSCTQILQQSGFIDSRWYTEEGRDRGHAVHALSDMDFRNRTDAINPTLAGYLEGRRRFVEDHNFVWEGGEQPLIGEIGGCYYGVTPDFYGHFRGKPYHPVIVEIKTYTVPEWVGLQTAAQEIALMQNGLIPKVFRGERLGLQLFDDGHYKVYPFWDWMDIQKWGYKVAGSPHFYESEAYRKDKE
jgi:hypothetical protein